MASPTRRSSSPRRGSEGGEQGGEPRREGLEALAGSRGGGGAESLRHQPQVRPHRRVTGRCQVVRAGALLVEERAQPVGVRLDPAQQPLRSGVGGAGTQVTVYSGPLPPSGGVSLPPLAVIAPHWTQLDGFTLTVTVPFWGASSAIS